MKVSKEAVDSLLERIGIKGMAEELLPLPKDVFDLSPENPALKEHLIWVSPGTLEEVRMLIGTPLEIGEKNKENRVLPEGILEAALTAEKNENPESMDRRILHSIANQLLHFPCQETEKKIQENPIYQKAAQEILNIAKAIPVLLAQDLVVEDREIYCISVNVAVFRNITIKGSGSISFGTEQVKLVAENFYYDPN